MFYSPSYIPPSPTSPASPLSLLDSYEMADMIRRTLTWTNPAIASEIAEHIERNISGNDFLDLSMTDLRMLAKDNDQVFKELRRLQKTRISPTETLSSSLPSLASIFSEGSSGRANSMDKAAVIDRHTNESGSSVMLSAQIPGDFNDEAWDFGDEDDVRSPILRTTVIEAAVLQDDTNHSPDPVLSANPALENESPLASNLEPAIPITDTDTAPTDGATHVHSAEAHNLEFQPISSEPIDADDASVYEIDESHLAINSLGSQSESRLDGENTHLQNDSVLGTPAFRTPSTRSPSPALSYLSCDDDEDLDAATHLPQIHLGNNVPIPHNTQDHNIPVAHDTPPTLSRPSSPAPEPLTQVFLDVHQLESLLSGSLDHPEATQTTRDPNILIEHDMLPMISIPSTLADSWQITEDEEALEPPCLPASEPAAPTMVNTWQILIEEDEETLESPHLPASEPAASSSDTHLDVNEAPNGRTYEAPLVQSSNPSGEEPEDAIHEVDSPRCSNTSSMDRRNSFTSNETHEFIESRQWSSQSSPSSSTFPPEPSHVINDPNESNVDTDTFALPMDIIPVTPLNSPIFEGLSQYMILGAVLGVKQDNLSTPVQGDIPTGERTLRSSSEAPQIGLPVSSVNEQSPRSVHQPTNPPESPGPNADVAIQLDLPYSHHLSHVRVWNPDLGMSRSTSTLEHMQSEILHLMPTVFALRRETIDRTI